MSKYIIREIDELQEISYLSYYTRGLNGSFIAGGCFKNVFTKEPVKDIDIFFETPKDFEEAVEKIERREGIRRDYANDNCIGYIDTNTGVKFELIRSIFGTKETVLDNFDFTLTKFAFSKHFEGEDKDGFPTYTWEIIQHKDFFQHLAQKRLVIDLEVEKIPFPYSSFERMFRYSKYGFQPCRETKIKIIQAMRLQENFNGNDDISKGMYEGGWD